MASWLVSVCAAAQALEGKGRFWLAVARQGWRRRFRQAGWRRQRFWRLRRRLVGQVLGNCGALVGERPFGVAEVLEGKTAVCASFLPGKAGADVVGQAVWQRQWFYRLGRGRVGRGYGDCERVSWQRPVLSTKVMDGKRPFYVKLLGSSQRRS
jgi:hypothetical protein